MSQRITDEQKQEIVKRYQDGYESLDRVSRSMYLNSKVVKRVLVEMGCRIRNQKEAAAVSLARKRSQTPAKYIPTKEELQKELDAIQQKWSPQELQQRLTSVSQVPWEVPTTTPATVRPGRASD